MAQLIGYDSAQWTAEDLTRRFGPIPLARIVFDPAPGTATVEDVIEFGDHNNQLCELYDGTLVRKAQIVDVTAEQWTAEDLFRRLGPIPLWRIVADPAPGTATLQDAIDFDAHKDQLCELIDGTLVRKTVGFYESFLALRLAMLITQFVSERNLGVVAGEAGMMHLPTDEMRIPDVSFVSHERLKNSGFPEAAAPRMAPELAVEVISRSNTREEMERKLGEYFEAGTKAVWYVYPKTRKIVAYTSPESFNELDENDTLDGGEVLPGFRLNLKDLFATPDTTSTQPK